ncbi:glycosyltransferase family 2 protein [Lactococcus raffinolactis]|uniref:glycosyltransferase family 2 protein n=1 Tax=Pseudolactococcus raffinolactis TaxID=1366 RepID=UPI00077BB060|nr:glycosyltransferase family 2 protein [Lactococcus raffinolactis]PCS13310.1 hypothetical protein RU88_GL000188 [Lactococcus raffinolactis]HBZ60806.1 glycosyltransferase family 2 protein [Lactococcus sp.]
MKPLISVIITNYNYGQYIEKAIQSVSDQTYANIELLIYDDGSNDHSVELIEKILPSVTVSKVKFIQQENQGIVKTRNRALKELTGDYYIFLDADDYFDSDFVDSLYQIAAETGVDVVYPNWHVIELDTGKDYHTDFPEFSLEGLQRQQVHITPESLVKTAAVENVEFQSEFIAEDWQFFLHLAFLGKTFKLAKTSYINYQVKANSRTSRNSYTEDTFAFEAILDEFREEFTTQVIEQGYIAQKRTAELEVDRAAIQERLRISEENLSLLSQSNTYLTEEVAQLEQQKNDLMAVITQKETHIQNLEQSKLGRLQRFFRRGLRK